MQVLLLQSTLSLRRALERTLASRLPMPALEQATAERQPLPGLVHHSEVESARKAM